MTLLATLKSWLQEQKLDAVLISSRQNKQPHLGISTASGYVLVTRQHAHILVDSRYYADIAGRVQGYQLHLLDATHSMTSIINHLIKEEGLRRIGFEGDQVSWQTGNQWRETLNTELCSITLDGLRQIKTADEIQTIKVACRIADQACEHIRRFIEPGMREREVAAELEWKMKQLGAEKASFDTIVASGTRGALPHGKASEKIIESGEFVTLDFGAQYQGYCSDMTRTFFVAGKALQPEQHPLFDIYQTVLESQLAAIAAVRPGVPCQVVDNAARSVINASGHGHHFGHNTGHAIGIEVHENPRFSPSDTTLLKPGMLLTVEPGIYLPGEGGVRIEDVILVTETGCEVLYSMPKTLLLTGVA
ncbi:aminopeptidase [Buttiauxella sp. WJP83]|uniref:aminopeptidase n=1 Tax=Buttiauxella sp. WJP83 TaxID=2986951 RepID=UPI0022DD64D5|nr:aminopeptidase [Buttiauxella sp. WJP83]WBM69638.1 aminopeptidase [Buttiauxella sp. WJP83]